MYMDNSPFVTRWDIYYKYNKNKRKKQGEDYLKLKMQNAKLKGASADYNQE